jgi:hypothetical protein
MGQVCQHAKCKADWQLNDATLEETAATNTKLIFNLKKQWLLDFIVLSDVPKLEKMALVCSAVGPVNCRKNQKQLKPYSQRHIFSFTRGFSLFAKYHSYQRIPFRSAKGRASIAVRNYVNLNPETCLLLIQQRPQKSSFQEEKANLYFSHCSAVLDNTC